MSNEELDLLNEMKENCLKKGQYIDEKAKDKFNMLCHCEDFIIENYEQKQEIERLNNIINELDTFLYDKIEYDKSTWGQVYSKPYQICRDKIKELKGDGSNGN